MEADESTVTADDLVVLNRLAVARAAGFARLAGTALVIIGVLGLAASVWLAVRQQQAIEGSGYQGLPDDSADVSLATRIDLLVGPIGYLVSAALTGGAGLALRLFADYSVARTGGSATGYQIGDRMPGDDDADDS